MGGFHRFDVRKVLEGQLALSFENLRRYLDLHGSFRLGDVEVASLVAVGSAFGAFAANLVDVVTARLDHYGRLG
jgi:hypothetical protein